jgi:hypothetical protein
MAMVKTQIPEGYATIRRSKSRAKKLRNISTSSNDNQQFEMIDMSDRNSIGRKYESDILYSNHQNDIYDASEMDEGVINDIETDADVFVRKTNGSVDYYGDDKRRTFETFKPKEIVNIHSNSNSNINNNNSNNNNDLSQSTDYIQSLSYDLLMTPLKSPQYINQLNAMRTSSAVQRQFPLYSRPESPKYGKLSYHNNNRSTSPSADSMDNCSSSSSTYAPTYRNSVMTATQDDDNLILIDNNRKPPLKSTTLSYRKSFSHINRSHHLNGENNNNYVNRKLNGSFMSNAKPLVAANSQEFISYEKPSISERTKPLAVPSISTSNLYTRGRFATLAHPREKLHVASTKSTTSLNENHVFWDPVLDSKIGSQTTLRTKPAIPWWEIACKKEYRQSCPPMQVNIFYVSYYLFKFMFIHTEFPVKCDNLLTIYLISLTCSQKMEFKDCFNFWNIHYLKNTLLKFTFSFKFM